MFNFFGLPAKSSSAPKIGTPIWKGDSSTTDIMQQLQVNPEQSVVAEIDMLQSILYNKDPEIKWIEKIAQSCRIWTTQLQREPSLKTRYQQQLLNILCEFAGMMNHINAQQDLDRLLELYCAIGGERSVIENSIKDNRVTLSEQQQPASLGNSDNMHEAELVERQAIEPKAVVLDVDRLVSEIGKGSFQLDRVDEAFQNMTQASIDIKAILELVKAVISKLQKDLKRASPQDAIEKIKALFELLSKHRPLFETAEIVHEVQQELSGLLMFDAFTALQGRLAQNQQQWYFQQLRNIVAATPWLEEFTRDTIITKIDRYAPKNTVVNDHQQAPAFQSSMKNS